MNSWYHSLALCDDLEEWDGWRRGRLERCVKCCMVEINTALYKYFKSKIKRYKKMKKLKFNGSKNT